MADGPVFFAEAAEFRVWLTRNHRSATELMVGFYRVGSGKPSMTWPESVAEALCFGWIDGVRRRRDAERYTIRFTPRRKESRWSAVNIRLATELEAAGRITEAGRAAFACRDPASAGYSYERRNAELGAVQVREFRRNKRAWAFFEGQPPGHRRLAAWYVMSAKREETRARRLARLVEASAAGRRLTDGAGE